MSHQVFIGATEMLVPKETIISRQGGRMNGSQYQMLIAVNKRAERDGKADFWSHLSNWTSCIAVRGRPTS